MKVTGSSGLSGPVGAGRTRPSGPAQEGFRLSSVAAPQAPAQTQPSAAAQGVVGLEALLALQDVGGPLERRRRAVGRAGRILDVLDGLRLSLLSGELEPGDLERLQVAVREQRDQTDDPALEQVLNEIELRAEVEMAKLEQARRVP